MISINVIDKYPRTEKVCNFCLERIEKKEIRIRTTERKSRKPDKLKVSHYHILCAAKSKNAELESAVLKYAYDLRLKRDAITKLIEAIEDDICEVEMVKICSTCKYFSKQSKLKDFCINKKLKNMLACNAWINCEMWEPK